MDQISLFWIGSPETKLPFLGNILQTADFLKWKPSIELTVRSYIQVQPGNLFGSISTVGNRFPQPVRNKSIEYHTSQSVGTSSNDLTSFTCIPQSIPAKCKPETPLDASLIPSTVAAPARLSAALVSPQCFRVVGFTCVGTCPSTHGTFKATDWTDAQPLTMPSLVMTTTMMVVTVKCIRLKSCGTVSTRQTIEHGWNGFEWNWCQLVDVGWWIKRRNWYRVWSWVWAGNSPNSIEHFVLR